MFLKSVRIKNYKSLKNVSVDFDDTTIFIGENNAGKTACLEIIKNVLGRTTQSAYFDEYDYYVSSTSESPQSSDGISIVFIFQELKEDDWEEDLQAKFSSVLQEYFDIELSKKVWQIKLHVESKFNTVTEQFEVKYAFLNANDEFLPLKNQGVMNEFLKTNPVFYLKALRDSNEVFSGKSFMWGRFLKQVKFESDDLKNLQDNIETLNADIITKDESLSELVESMNEIGKILDFNSADGSVSVNALPIKSWDLLSKAQVVLTNQENISFPLEKYGQGTQSMSIILLYEAYINILLKKAYTKFSEAILTLEEPEAHLHPQAIRAFEKQLKRIETQKIITSHSPYFLQNVDIRNVRVFKKEKGETKIYTIPKSCSILLPEVHESIAKIVSASPDIFDIKDCTLIAKRTIPKAKSRGIEGIFGKFYPESLISIQQFITQATNIFSEEELYQLNTFVQKTRGEILFAKGWLMAEGQTEAILLPYFAKVLGCDLDEHGITYIEYRSNGSARAFTKLAKVLNFEWSLLADNDLQGENTLSEIKDNLFQEGQIAEKFRKTEAVDIEHELANKGFLNDYEAILSDEITPSIANLKSNSFEQYKLEIVKLIQSGKGKVKNAYKLIEHLEHRKMSPDEIPIDLKHLIERLCLHE